MGRVVEGEEAVGGREEDGWVGKEGAVRGEEGGGGGGGEGGEEGEVVGGGVRGGRRGRLVPIWDSSQGGM